MMDFWFYSSLSERRSFLLMTLSAKRKPLLMCLGYEKTTWQGRRGQNDLYLRSSVFWIRLLSTFLQRPPWDCSTELIQFLAVWECLLRSASKLELFWSISEPLSFWLQLPDGNSFCFEVLKKWWLVGKITIDQCWWCWCGLLRCHNQFFIAPNSIDDGDAQVHAFQFWEFGTDMRFWCEVYLKRGGFFLQDHDKSWIWDWDSSMSLLPIIIGFPSRIDY